MKAFTNTETPSTGFEPIVVGWKDQKYTVAPDRCMGLLARIENVLAPNGQGDVFGMLTQPHRAHLTRLASAYAEALRYAGCDVTNEEVYLSLAREVQNGGKRGFAALVVLAEGLLTMFFPDWVKDEPSVQGEGASGNGQAGEASREVSSATTMKPASAAAG